MSIARDMSERARPPQAWPPDPIPMFSPLAAAAWGSRDEEGRTRPKAADTPFRHSDAGNCSRRLQYQLTDEPVSDERTEPDYWRLAVGKMVHDVWQTSLVDALAALGWRELEPEFQVATHISSGHLDLYGVDPFDTAVAFEAKSINGTGFKTISGLTKKPAGPRSGDLLQGCVNAHSAAADQLVLAYVALELVAPWMRDKFNLNDNARFAAEWTLDRPTFQPLAEEEIGRWDGVLAATDAGNPVPRQIPNHEYPPDAVIVDPTRGRWEVQTPDGYVTATGNAWECDYCPFRTRCAQDVHVSIHSQPST